MTPLISVVIPAYNSAHFLPRVIESVLSQSFADLECVVVDDGSTDETASLVEQLMANDARVRYSRKSNGGVASARNAGFAIASGEWIQFIDADDLMFPDTLEAELAAVAGLDDRTNVVVYSDWECATERNGHVVESRKLVCEPVPERELLDLMVGWRFTCDLPLNADNMLYHRTVLERHRFNEELISEEVTEISIRMLMSGVRFVHSPVLGISRRVHGANMTADHRRTASGYLGLVRVLGEQYPSVVGRCVGVQMLLGMALRNGDVGLMREVADTLEVGPIPIPFRNGLRLANKAGLMGTVLAGWRLQRAGVRILRRIRRRLSPLLVSGSLFEFENSEVLHGLRFLMGIPQRSD